MFKKAFKVYYDPLADKRKSKGTKLIVQNVKYAAKVLSKEFGLHLEGHSEAITCLAVSSDDRLLVSGSKDSTVRIWNLIHYQQSKILRLHTGPVTCLTFSRNNLIVFSASKDSSLCAWDLFHSTFKKTTLSSPITAMKLDHIGHLLFIGLENSTVQALNAADLTFTGMFFECPYQASAINITPDDKFLLIHLLAKEFIVLEVSTGNLLWRVPSIQNKKLSDLIISRKLEIHADYGSVRLYHFPMSLEEAKVCKYDFGRVIIEDKKPLFLLTLDSKSIQEVWTTSKYLQVASSRCHKQSISFLRVTHDGQRIITGSEDCTIRLWDVDSLSLEAVLPGHCEEVTCLALTSDNKYVVTGSLDKTVRIWDVDKKHQEIVLREHKGIIISVAVSTGNKYALSGSGDGTLRVWKLKIERITHLH